MCANKVTIVVDSQHLNQYVATAAALMRKPRVMMLEIAEELHAQSMKMFDEQGYPSNSWQDLRPRTKKQRQNKGKWPGKILQLNGQLASSIQTNAGDDYAEVGTNLVYAQIQFFGGTIQRRGTVRLRTDSKGNLLKRGNLATFAKKRHKRAVSRAVNYTISIPARRYLPVLPSGELTPPAQNNILSIVSTYMTPHP